MKGHKNCCNFLWFYSFCSVMTMDSKTCRRQHERHERVTEPFVQDRLSVLSFCGLISIKGWKLKRLLTYESIRRSSYTGTVKIKIKYFRAIFFRKGKCLGSSCSDHPASLHKWGPWYHRETRMFQLHSFVRKEREMQRLRTGRNYFFWLSCLLISEKNFWLWCVAIIYLLKITTFLKHCL